MTDLLEKLEAAIALDEQWALAASFDDDGGPAIPGGAHWVFGVGDNWDHYKPDPLEEYLGENAEDNGSIALVTIEERTSRWGGSPMPAVAVVTGIEQIRTVDAAHIIRNDPARVLRRVARDRKLLERHKPFEVWGGGGHVERWLIAVECSYCWNFDRGGDRDDYGAGREWPCGDVRDLAEDYEIEVGL